MRREHGDTGQILNGLVCGHIPLIVAPVQVAQVAGQARTHAHEFVGQLVESLGGDSRLESDCGNQLLIKRGVGVFIGYIQYLRLHLSGESG